MGRLALTTAGSRPTARGRRLALAVAMVTAVALGEGAVRACVAQAHPGGHWITLRTAHFRIHVRPEQESLGVRVAGEAEAAFAALALHLPAPRGTIEVVVADNADVANGFTTVFPAPRVVLFPVPAVDVLELQRYDRWLRLLVTHELAHVFHLDLARGWWRLGRSVLGRAPALFPNAFLPTWLVEGLAVHYESALTGGGRNAGSYHRAVVAAQAAERGGLTIDAANAASPRWPGGYRPYAFGAAFLGRVAADRGDSVLDRLALETARAPVPYLLVDGAARRATGRTFSAAWRAWQDDVRAQASRPVGRPGEEAVAEGAPIRGLRSPVPPRVSSDGRRVLFALDDGRDVSRIAVLDRADGSVRTLARLDGGLGLAWDTAGGVVAAEYDFTDPYTLRADLVRIDVDGRERRLTSGAGLLAPDVAPDGSVVAVRVGEGGNALVRWSGGVTSELLPQEAGVEWAHPRVSPDGRHLAATRARGGWLDVVVVSSGSASPRELSHDAAIDQMPAFSPDGRWIFWASDRTGRPQVHATRVEGGDGTWWRVTDEPFAAYAPAPAGDSVFYLAYHHDGYRLATVPLDTLQWTRVGPGGPAAAEESAPADAAPAAAIVDRRAYSPWPALWPKYWLPLGVVEGSGTWAGIFTSGRDALDRHAYAGSAMIGSGLARGTWQADVTYQYAGFAPAVVDASYSRGEHVALTAAAGDTSGGAERCCVRTEDATAGVTVRHRRFRWSAAARLGAEYERDGPRTRVGGVLSATAARLVAPAFAISPQSGWRVSATARRRWRRDGAGGYDEGVVQGAAYLPLGVLGFARQVIAVHLAAGTLAGSDTVFYGAGGVSGGTVPLLPGVAVGSSRRTFAIRGFAPSSAIGRSAATASVEYRLPLALVGRGWGLFPAALDRLSVAAFGDAGIAWSSSGWTAKFPGLPGSTTLVSAGAELAADVGVVYDFPLRLRAGLARRLRGGSGTAAFAAVGAAF